MLCGKIAAGKSTLALKLAAPARHVLVSEDVWLKGLFADEMTDAADYVRCAHKLRGVMGPHVAEVLRGGLSVVLDFPANTVVQRAWMRGILDATNAAHALHLLTPPDAVCLERLHRRNARGDHAFAATEAQFHQFSKHFSAPTPDEGFTILHHPGDESFS